jgi:hypothetical protein
VRKEMNELKWAQAPAAEFHIKDMVIGQRRPRHRCFRTRAFASLGKHLISVFGLLDNFEEQVPTMSNTMPTSHTMLLWP